MSILDLPLERSAPLSSRWLDRVSDDRSRLIRVVERVAGSRDEAEEAVQEAIVRAWKAETDARAAGGAKVDERKSVRGWIVAIARNVALDRRRSRARRREFVQPDVALPMPSERAVTPSLRMRESESATALQRAIASLPAIGQEIIRLRHEDGLAFTLVAQELEIPEVTARKRYSRALVQLREAMAGSAA